MFRDNPDAKVLTQEKQDLQATLKVLTEEVEFLSKRNENFLKELKHRNFYTAYKDCSDELTKLREAHALLINMIQAKEVTITKTASLKNLRKPQNYTSVDGFSLMSSSCSGNSNINNKLDN